MCLSVDIAKVVSEIPISAWFVKGINLHSTLDEYEIVFNLPTSSLQYTTIKVEIRFKNDPENMILSQDYSDDDPYFEDLADLIAKVFASAGKVQRQRIADVKEFFRLKAKEIGE